MKTLLKLEEFGLVLLSAWLFAQLDYAWWWYPLLFFTPDLSMLGYIINPRIGAYTYNLIHHKGTAAVVYIAGLTFGASALLLAGAILLGHSSFDRIFGYGLKCSDAFQHTHMGMIGGAKAKA